MENLEPNKTKIENIFDCLDIDNLAKLPGVLKRSNNSVEEYSTHTGITSSKFVEIDGQRYFVKYPTLSGNNNIHEIFIELFVSFLAKKVGIECIDTKLLIDYSTHTLGIASPDFGEHVTYGELGGQIQYGGISSNVQEIINKLQSKSEKFTGVEINSQEILEKLNKVCCFDYLIKQSDRHLNNIAFVVKQMGNQQKLDLAPLYDNANAFLLKTNKYYKINPNDNRKFGIEQQKLLNNTYSAMRDKFENMFSEENYNNLLTEFNSIYGIDKLFANKTSLYNILTTKIQAAVKERLTNCKNRAVQEEYIPMEAVYIVINQHKDEITKAKFDEMVSALYDYYNNDSYNKFYNGEAEKFSKWLWYDECKELAKNINGTELLHAHKELESNKREYFRKLLSLSMKNTFVYHDSVDDFGAVLFNRQAFINRTKKDNKEVASQKRIRHICNNYSIYNELLSWCEQIKNDAEHLSPQERKELKETKNILKKYTRYVNSCTNKNLSESDKELLEHYGEEYGAEYGA